MKKGMELVEMIMEIAESWANDCYEEVADVKINRMSEGSGYIELTQVMYYLKDIKNLERRLKKVGVEITSIEAPGVNDEGMLIWFQAW